jgi:MFS superfamily sulfate permease-like transporter
MVPMAVYALLGGSRTLSVSTTSTVAVLTGSTLVSASIASGADDPARALATLTLLVGAILLVARVLRLAVLIDNISGATLTGVKVGVGLTVAAGQVPKLLGIPSDPDATSFFPEVRDVLEGLDDISWATAALSAGTLAALLVVPHVLPRIPAPLVAVIGGILLVAVGSIDEHGVALIAPVPSGLPTPVAPTADGFDELLPGAFAIAIMVFLETLAVARAVRRPSEPPIDNGRELVASGLSNAAGAFFRAMPSAGGFSPTASNQRSGARTQLCELVTVVLALACALFLGSLLSDLPEATLGCMVVIAVVGLIKPAEFRRLARTNHLELWIAIATAACGLLLGLLAAVLVGVILTLLLVLIELDRVGVTELQPTPDGDDLRVAGSGTAPVEGLLVLRLDAPLYTANVRSVNRRVLEAAERHPGTRVLVLDATAQGALTTTIIDEGTELDRALRERGIVLWMAALQPEALRAARDLPVWPELVESGRTYHTALAAVRAYLDAAAVRGS